MKNQILSIILIATAIISFYNYGQTKTDSKGEPAVKVVNASGGLRMRSSPDIKGDLIVVIPEKRAVEVLEESGEALSISGRIGRWNRVLYNGRTGWVFGGFLSDPENGSLAWLETFPFSKKIRNLIEIKRGEFYFQESCDSALYHEIVIRCRNFPSRKFGEEPEEEDYNVDSLSKVSNGKKINFCDLQVFIGRNPWEPLILNKFYTITSVERKKDTYTILSETSERFVFTWPSGTQGIIMLDNKPYAVHGSNFYVRKANCGSY